jgi:VCBS repeat-containing protein
LIFTLDIPGALNGSTMVTATGYFEYTPHIGYTGSDSFSYTISDGTLSATGKVNLTVNPNNYNASPLTFSGAFSLSEDQTFSSTLSGSDPEGVPLTFILDQNVTHGTLSLSATGGFIYTPNANYNGSDTFTFHVSDGVNSSLISTGTFAIVPVNDAPTAANDIVTGTEDTSLALNPILNDTDVD